MGCLGKFVHGAEERGRVIPAAETDENCCDGGVGEGGQVDELCLGPDHTWSTPPWFFEGQYHHSLPYEIRLRMWLSMLLSLKQPTLRNRKTFHSFFSLPIQSLILTFIGIKTLY